MANGKAALKTKSHLFISAVHSNVHMGKATGAMTNAFTQLFGGRRR
jgi:hypothetical protein